MSQREQTAEYILEMVKELAALASSNEMPFLAHLLGITALAAEDVDATGDVEPDAIYRRLM